MQKVQGRSLDSYLKIIDLLKERSEPQTITQIAIALNISNRAVSNILHDCRHARLVTKNPKRYEYLEPEIMPSNPTKSVPTKKPSNSPNSAPAKIPNEKVATPVKQAIPLNPDKPLAPQDLKRFRDRVFKVLKGYRNGAIPVAEAKFLSLCAFPDEDY